jgi:hypothetical protein
LVLRPAAGAGVQAARGGHEATRATTIAATDSTPMASAVERLVLHEDGCSPASSATIEKTRPATAGSSPAAAMQDVQ